MSRDLGRVAGPTRYPVESTDGGVVRCRLVDLLGDGATDDGLLRLLGRERDTVFGIRVTVERGGTVRVGEAARLLRPATAPRG